MCSLKIKPSGASVVGVDAIGIDFATSSRVASSRFTRIVTGARPSKAAPICFARSAPNRAAKRATTKSGNEHETAISSTSPRFTGGNFPETTRTNNLGIRFTAYASSCPSSSSVAPWIAKYVNTRSRVTIGASSTSRFLPSAFSALSKRSSIARCDRTIP
jgi:hypothetical protein